MAAAGKSTGGRGPRCFVRLLWNGVRPVYAPDQCGRFGSGVPRGAGASPRKISPALRRKSA